MHPRIKNWIFVTGAPRSATTFVGTTLSAPINVDYLHEPFNPDCGIRGITTRYLYLEAGDREEQRLRPEIERLFDYHAPLKTGFYPNDRPFQRFAKRFVGSRGPFHLRLARLNPFHDTAVIKDPIGCLLTEYLLLRYGVRPIVVLRNPLGFAASTRRLNWDLSLEPLLSQRRLVERFLEPSDVDVARRCRHGTPLQRAAALWRLLNRILLAMAAQHPDEILVVTHEEINQDPLPVFERIFSHAGLPFSPSLRARVLRNTRADDEPADESGPVQRFRRDSRLIDAKRRALLTDAEMHEVRLLTAPVADLRYGSEVP